MEINEKIGFEYARIDTGSLRDLAAASCKLFQEDSHGKIYTYLDSASAFLQTAVFSVIRLVNHVALCMFSLFGISSPSGHHFFRENITRCCIDLTGILFGLIGTILPYTALYATAQEIKILNSSLLDRTIISKAEEAKGDYVDPLWITRYLWAYQKNSTDNLVLSFGGPEKVIILHKSAPQNL